jgi:hypothetical protein
LALDAKRQEEEASLNPVPWIKSNSKWLVSLGCTTIFVSIYLFVLQPGYAVNDDISMISLVSGYLGGAPVPFMVFSNVILGFLLKQLYTLPSRLNWEILIFVGLNFLSVWALAYIFTFQRLDRLHRIAAILLILASDSLILISLTFTTIAAFAAIAGFCLVYMGAFIKVAPKRRWLFFGAFLIVTASLIRIESVLLVFLVIVTPTLLLFRYLYLKRLLITVGITGLVVLGGFMFDRAFVSNSPDWNSYYQYNQTRSLLQDTPRYHLENIGNMFRNIGWNGNDYRMFVDWFFPDPQLYSISNLRYLVEHVPGTERSLLSAAISYFYPQPIFDSADAFPFFLIIAAAWLAVLLYPFTRPAVLPLLGLLASFLLLVIYLIWTEKVPPHVWYSFLATVSVMSLCILAWTKADESETGHPPTTQKRVLRGRSFLLAALVIVAAALSLYRASAITQDNLYKQAAYQRVLSDLDSLQAQGKILPNALIVSPASGIPLDWSNPLVLDLPRIQYFELGWLTFSPAYYEVLNQHRIQTLPAGLYQQDGVYLLARPGVRDGILQFIRDHSGLAVQVATIYSIKISGPNIADSSNIQIYKLNSGAP